VLINAVAPIGQKEYGVDEPMAKCEHAKELLAPGETALCVCTDGRYFDFKSDGRGSTGNWKINPKRQVDRVIIYRRTPGESSRTADVFTALHDGVMDSETDGRFVVLLLDVQLAGTTNRTWREFSDARQNPVRYVSRVT